MIDIFQENKILITSTIFLISISIFFIFMIKNTKTFLTKENYNQNEEILINNNKMFAILKNEKNEKNILSIQQNMKNYNCNKENVYCLNDENCKTLCLLDVSKFKCIKNVCISNVLNSDGTINENNDTEENTNEHPCNTKIGEIAAIVGYTELGLAQWECINLYPMWSDKEKFCENGTIDIDVRKRKPSYRDCTCKDNDKKILANIIKLNDEEGGLPHCVENYLPYSLSYSIVD